MNQEQGILLNILNESLGHSARVTYLYEGSPVSMRINNLKKKLTVSENEIEIGLKIGVIISEFPKDHLQDKQTRMELEKFLSINVEEEMNKVIVVENRISTITVGKSNHVLHQLTTLPFTKLPL